MSPKLIKALDALQEVVKAEATATCSSVTVVFSAQGYTISYQTQDPRELRDDGVSMKNLKGLWIE